MSREKKWDLVVTVFILLCLALIFGVISRFIFWDDPKTPEPSVMEMLAGWPCLPEQKDAWCSRGDDTVGAKLQLAESETARKWDCAIEPLSGQTVCSTDMAPDPDTGFVFTSWYCDPGDPRMVDGFCYPDIEQAARAKRAKAQIIVNGQPTDCLQRHGYTMEAVQCGFDMADVAGGGSVSIPAGIYR